jgi:hypothetical protein
LASPVDAQALHTSIHVMAIVRAVFIRMVPPVLVMLLNRCCRLKNRCSVRDNAYLRTSGKSASDYSPSSSM